MSSIDRPVDSKGRVVLQHDVVQTWRASDDHLRVTMRPNAFAILLHPKFLPLKHIIRSTEILLEDLQHQREVEDSSANKNRADPLHTHARRSRLRTTSPRGKSKVGAHR